MAIAPSLVVIRMEVALEGSQYPALAGSPVFFPLCCSFGPFRCRTARLWRAAGSNVCFGLGLIPLDLYLAAECPRQFFTLAIRSVLCGVSPESPFFCNVCGCEFRTSQTKRSPDHIDKLRLASTTLAAPIADPFASIEPRESLPSMLANAVCLRPPALALERKTFCEEDGPWCRAATNIVFVDEEGWSTISRR